MALCTTLFFSPTRQAPCLNEMFVRIENSVTDVLDLSCVDYRFQFLWFYLLQWKTSVVRCQILTQCHAVQYTYFLPVKIMNWYFFNSYSVWFWNCLTLNKQFFLDFPNCNFSKQWQTLVWKKSLKNSTMNFSRYRTDKNLLQRINFRRCKKNWPHLETIIQLQLDKCLWIFMHVVNIMCFFEMCVCMFCCLPHFFLIEMLITSRIRTDFTLSLNFLSRDLFSLCSIRL